MTPGPRPVGCWMLFDALVVGHRIMVGAKVGCSTGASGRGLFSRSSAMLQWAVLGQMVVEQIVGGWAH